MEHMQVVGRHPGGAAGSRQPVAASSRAHPPVELLLQPCPRRIRLSRGQAQAAALRGRAGRVLPVACLCLQGLSGAAGEHRRAAAAAVGSRQPVCRCSWNCSCGRCGCCLAVDPAGRAGTGGSHIQRHHCRRWCWRRCRAETWKRAWRLPAAALGCTAARRWPAGVSPGRAQCAACCFGGCCTAHGALVAGLLAGQTLRGGGCDLPRVAAVPLRCARCSGQLAHEQLEPHRRQPAWSWRRVLPCVRRAANAAG